MGMGVIPLTKHHSSDFFWGSAFLLVALWKHPTSCRRHVKHSSLVPKVKRLISSFSGAAGATVTQNICRIIVSTFIIFIIFQCSKKTVWSGN